MRDKKKLIKSVITGMVCGILTSVVLMSVFAVVMTKVGLLPGQLIDYILTGFLGLGALAGGFLAAKLNKGAGLIAGAATGGAMLAALVLTAAFSGSADFSVLFLFKLAATVAGGALGGILAVREKKRVRI